MQTILEIGEPWASADLPRKAAPSLLLLLALVAGLVVGPLGKASRAADPSLSARISPQTIRVGESAELIVTVSGASMAGAPSIPRIDKLEIENRGQTMSMRIVDGDLTTENTYTFVLRPAQAGRFDIPALELVTGATVLRSEPVRLEVLPRSAPAPRAGRGEAPALARMEIHGLPSRDLYVGEVVPIEVRLFVKEGVLATQATRPGLRGSDFTLATPSEDPPAQQRVRLSDGVYTRLDFVGALSPIRPGEAGLEATIDLTLKVPASQARRARGTQPFFGSLFGPPMVERKLEVASPERRISVRALPDEGRPADFSGAIGRFSFARDAAPMRVAIGDPITLRVTATGEGNFDRILIPGFEGSGNWKTYPATQSFVSPDGLGLAGTKTFEEAILPMEESLAEIPARTLSYFDPDKGRYVGIDLPAIPIEVVGVGAPLLASGPRTAGIRGEAYALAPNRIELGPVVNELGATITWPLFLPLALSPLLGTLGAFAWESRRRRRSGDPRERRRRELRAERKSREAEMAEALRRNDASAFFRSARLAVAQSLVIDAPEIGAESLTRGDVSRLVVERSDLEATIYEIFDAADALSYGGQAGTDADLNDWQARVRDLLGLLDPEGRP